MAHKAKGLENKSSDIHDSSMQEFLDMYHEETADARIQFLCRVARLVAIEQTWWSYKDIMNFELEHSFIGAKTVRFIDGHDSELIIDVSITGATWLDLWKAADRAVVASNEDREVAIEGFSHTLGDSIALLEVGT